MHSVFAMGICSASDMYGDTRYGDLNPHTACQQVSGCLHGCLHGRRLHGRRRTCHSSQGVCFPRLTRQSREATGPLVRRYSRAWVTRTPLIGVVGGALSRARALRGRVSGNSGSACHYPAPGARSRSALQDSQKLLARHRKIPCEKACTWLGRSCALLAVVGSCRRRDINHFCGLSWRRASRRSLSNYIGPQEALLEAQESLRNTSISCWRAARDGVIRQRDAVIRYGDLSGAATVDMGRWGFESAHQITE
eukprot:69689-Chlamydomonas_euryale.AAC.1